MQNVLAAIFKTESEGFQAITELRQSPISDKATILQMALVKREGEGLKVCDYFDSGVNTRDDTALGGVLGGLVGILGGPIGVLLMGSYGMLAGSLMDADDALSGNALIETVGKKMMDGEIALVALTDELDESYLDGRLGKFGVEILRFDAAAVAEEVEEANRIQEELARQAKRELRAEKKAERKEKVEEKRSKISADFAAFKAKFKKDKDAEA